MADVDGMEIAGLAERTESLGSMPESREPQGRAYS